MSDFVKQLTNSIESQAAEIAELKQSLAALTDKLNPPKPAPMSPEGFGGGPQKVVETLEDTVSRIHQRAADHQALEASYMEKRREGLSDGEWRDDCGIIRDRKGKAVVRTARDDAAMAEFNKKAGADHIAWLKSVELPVRVNGYLASETDDDGEDDDE